MKIGLSFGRCVRDIVLEKVSFADVLVIVTRTMMHKREQIDGVIADYCSFGYLRGLDLEKCLEVGYRLWDMGKLHQPRCFNAGTSRYPAELVWFDVVPTALSDNPSVRSAWENYQLVLKLAGEELGEA